MINLSATTLRVDGLSFSFVSHFSLFLYSSESSWTVFVERSVTFTQTTGNLTNILETRAITRRFLPTVWGIHIFFFMTSWTNLSLCDWGLICLFAPTLSP